MNKKSITMIITLVGTLSMSACWKEFQFIAKRARGSASGVVLTEGGGPPPSIPPLNAAAQKKRDAIKNCTQLRELAQNAVLIFVDKNASHTNDGYSWRTAFKSVAQGVRAALAQRADRSNNGKKIYVLVAAATYNFNHEDAELKKAGVAAGLNNDGPIVPFNVPAQSNLMNDIEVVGGYVSNDLCFEDDINRVLNSEKNNERQTILDGQDKSNNVVAFVGNAHAKNLALRHFTIKGGHAKLGGGNKPGGAVSITSPAANRISNIILEDLTVEGESEVHGGCIGIRNAENISLDKVKFVNCVAAWNGGGLAITGAGTEDIKIQDCDFSGINKALIFGGGAAVFRTTQTEPLVPMTGPDIFTAARKPRVHFINTTITGAEARNGGGLAIVTDAERVKYEGGSISGNEAGKGSGIALSNNVNYVEFDQVKVEQNRRGSGIFASNQVKRVSFKGGSIRDHDVNSAGAGMRAEGVEGLWLKKPTIEGNRSQKSGGGLSLNGGQDIHIEETKFIGNRASIDGAGIAGTELRGSPVRIVAGEFSNNGATRDGGCVSIEESDNIIVRGTSFKNNWARNGGHIHVVEIKDNLRLENLILEGSHADNGAGIYAAGTNVPAHIRKLVMDDVKITDAQAQFSGGGAFLLNFKEISIAQSQFGETDARNRALDGGDLYLRDNNRILVQISQFKGSRARQDGGSIFINNVANANLIDVTIQESRSERDGGAIYARTLNNLGLDFVRLTDIHAGQDGGGAFIEAVTNLTVTGSAFRESSAQDGGGIYAKTVTNLAMDDVELSLNEARRNGGGAYVEGVWNARFTNHSMIDYNKSGRDGGGIFVKGVNDMSIQLSTLGVNSADRDGGNAFVMDLNDNFSISNSVITHGIAKRNAGGLYVKATGGRAKRLRLDAVAFLGNKVDGRGDGKKVVCLGAAGVFGEHLGYVELKNVTFNENVVESPAAGSNCAGAMKLYNLTAQPKALFVDFTHGTRSRVMRNEVRNPDRGDVAANHIYGAILVPKAVLTDENYVTDPDIWNPFANKPFVVKQFNENKPMQPILEQWDPAIAGTPVDRFGIDNRQIVVSVYD